MTAISYQKTVAGTSRQPTALESSADGWRGRIGIEFTPERALAIVRAIIDQHTQDRWRRPSRVLVGFDSRHLSEQVAQMACVAVRQRGPHHEVTLVRHLPTSTASFLVSREYDLAILVTASHNPANWNGIKVKIAPGISAPPEFVAGVDARRGSPAKIQSDEHSTITTTHDAGAFLKRHAKAAAAAFPTTSKKPFRVVIDGLGGIAEPALKTVGAHLGWFILPSHRKIDTTLCDQAPDPSKAEVLRELCARTVSEKADFGLALDGDGDRIFAITQEGDIVPSHDLMALLVMHATHSGKPLSRIAVTQSTGLSVRRAADEIGANVIETPIGFKYISKLLSDGLIDAGVGAVGDMAFRSYTLDRDPLFVAAHLSQLLNHSDVPLSTALSHLRLRLGTTGLSWIELHLPETRGTRQEELDVALTQAAHVVGIAPDLRERLSGGAVRLRAASGAWIMLRPSTTEGGLRIYGELFNSAQNITEVKAVIARRLSV